jgi:hypothetical protein
MAVAARAAEPVRVMIVGDFHMSNPGRDMHNATVDDVLTPRRQVEIAAAVDGLAAFRPTLVAAEWPADITSARYAEYRAGTLKPSHNEVVQLGFRLAAKMNLADVAGIDVDGDFPYEPVQAYADAHGIGTILAATNTDIERSVKMQDELLKSGTVSQVLRWMNDPKQIAHGNDFYRTMLRIGSGSAQPGADLLTAWYRRNFLICANLIQRTKPGDRVVVFYGSGHSFLLRQCVSETPGFELVEPNDYLPK